MRKIINLSSVDVRAVHSINKCEGHKPYSNIYMRAATIYCRKFFALSFLVKLSFFVLLLLFLFFFFLYVFILFLSDRCVIPFWKVMLHRNPEIGMTGVERTTHEERQENTRKNVIGILGELSFLNGYCLPEK